MLYNTFHIYNKNAPEWDSTVDKFEAQAPEVQLYYMLEFLKLRRGVSFGTVKIHPWLYWHLNYFNIMVDQQDEFGNSAGSKRMLPSFRDNEWIINEHLLEADSGRKKGIMIMGSRRLSKSVFEASYTGWNATVKEGGDDRPCLIAGGSVKDLNNITAYLETGMKLMHPMFNLYPPTTTNWMGDSGVKFGYKDTRNVGHIHSTVRVVNLASGSQSMAGWTPISAVFDEVGKVDIKHHFSVASPSLSTPYGWRVAPVLSGTGGSVDLVQPSKEMFYHPELHNFVKMKWDMLDNHTPPDLRTWSTGLECGVFLPGQVSLEFPKRKTTFAKYLKVENEYLDKIEFNETNWEFATPKLKEDQENARLVDMQTYLNRKTHYPGDVPDCFLDNKINPFPAADALTHRLELENSGQTDFGYDVKLEQGTNKLIITPSEKLLAGFPFEGGNIDSPVQIFISPPEIPKFNNLFVGGLDCYKQDKSSTSSLGTFYILQRMGKINDRNSYKIAASLATRPDSSEEFYTSIRTLQLGYGAKTLQEAADLGYEQFLKLKYKSQLHLLLVDGRRISKTGIGKLGGQSNVQFGLFPTKLHKQLVLDAAVRYCQEEVEIRNEDGDSELKKGVYRIDDVALLKEIEGYSDGRNVDRIVAFGHAVLWAEYLDSIHAVPDTNTTQEEQEAANVKHRPPINEIKKYNEHAIRQRRRVLGGGRAFGYRR